MGPGIDGETDEPNWDEKEAENFTPGKVIAKDPLIRNLSAEDADSAWIAAKIKYQKKVNGEWVDTTYAELDKFINIKTNGTDGFDTATWTMADNNETAYYKTVLAPQNATTSIFTDVEIDKLALTPDQIASATGDGTIQFDITKYEVKDADGGGTRYIYKEYEMCDFQIIVTGYLVQEDGFANAQAAMAEAFPNVF